MTLFIVVRRVKRLLLSALVLSALAFAAPTLTIGVAPATDGITLKDVTVVAAVTEVRTAPTTYTVGMDTATTTLNGAGTVTMSFDIPDGDYANVGVAVTYTYVSNSTTYSTYAYTNFAARDDVHMTLTPGAIILTINGSLPGVPAVALLSLLGGALASRRRKKKA
jgi:hypothetical protein